MRYLALFGGILMVSCVTTPSESESELRAEGPPVVSPGSLVSETAPPDAPVVERERCVPGDDSASGWPSQAQAEVGVFGTVPNSFGVPLDTRIYSRSGCEPAH